MKLHLIYFLLAASAMISLDDVYRYYTSSFEYWMVACMTCALVTPSTNMSITLYMSAFDFA
ncbi:hypothetical protein BDV40DRAFT_252389 [Aspergillus tamarii]|uniref:Uncharacterized protein n=1 Tax=Aspergillus tamarii TaxID=41984 RepID=A0A5N6VB80_ASPTM|nr:hypothetical protein BDV40DRAFT_252389 [Aspergillus tamarii]